MLDTSSQVILVLVRGVNEETENSKCEIMKDPKGKAENS